MSELNNPITGLMTLCRFDNFNIAHWAREVSCPVNDLVNEFNLEYNNRSPKHCCVMLTRTTMITNYVATNVT